MPISRGELPAMHVPEAENDKAELKPLDEIAVMRQMQQMFDVLTRGERERILRWAVARYPIGG